MRFRKPGNRGMRTIATIGCFKEKLVAGHPVLKQNNLPSEQKGVNHFRPKKGPGVQRKWGRKKREKHHSKKFRKTEKRILKKQRTNNNCPRRTKKKR